MLLYYLPVYINASSCYHWLLSTCHNILPNIFWLCLSFRFLLADRKTIVMWQEMRKHEKKLRGMIVDYKKRSERRKEYYERIVRWNSSFLSCHLVCLHIETRSSRILTNLGPTSKDSSRSSGRCCCWIDFVSSNHHHFTRIWFSFLFRTPWRDDESTLIDRFDVRSHLDIIDEYSLRTQQTQQGSESVLFRFCFAYDLQWIERMPQLISVLSLIDR